MLKAVVRFTRSKRINSVEKRTNGTTIEPLNKPGFFSRYILASTLEMDLCLGRIFFVNLELISKTSKIRFEIVGIELVSVEKKIWKDIYFPPCKLIESNVQRREARIRRFICEQKYHLIITTNTGGKRLVSTMEEIVKRVSHKEFRLKCGNFPPFLFPFYFVPLVPSSSNLAGNSRAHGEYQHP